MVAGLDERRPMSQSRISQDGLRVFQRRRRHTRHENGYTAVRTCADDWMGEKKVVKYKKMQARFGQREKYREKEREKKKNREEVRKRERGKEGG